MLRGLTRSLNINCLTAVPIGATIRLSSHVVQVGKTMAMIQGRMASLDIKTIYCPVEHHEVNVPVKPEYRNIRLSWDDGRGRERGAKGKEVGSKL
jgi:acyl-coenzyme A thioesterase 13